MAINKKRPVKKKKVNPARKKFSTTFEGKTFVLPVGDLDRPLKVKKGGKFLEAVPSKKKAKKKKKK